ncbi:MAG: glycoside hydrolase family 3 N-terminal domain-containing protein, partial [Hyphomicrobiaceae bacterium]
MQSPLQCSQRLQRLHTKSNGRLERTLAPVRSIAATLAIAVTILVIAPLIQAHIALETLVAVAGKRSHESNKTKNRKSQKAKNKASIRALERARQRNIPNKKHTSKRPSKPHATRINSTPIQNEERPTLNEKKAAVLAAPPELLKQIGRHLIVGYHAAYQLTPLLERGALGGVFVTSRNARGRSKAHLKKELASFKKLAADAGQNIFWLATDQEGGVVSRLSPPLPYQRSLRRTIANLQTPEDRHKAVAAYAARQAKALASLGINLNFAPVADVDHKTQTVRDRHTRIRYRAISDDPKITTNVARTYCNALSAENIHCTLKHFPGLGRVTHDTHVT